MTTDSGKPVHSGAFRLRRFFNWFPMGLTYALLYMGRYNLTVSKNALGELMTKEDFGIIFGAGTFTYAFSFLVNGPLVDKIGGRKGILISSLGAALMNLGMGLYLSYVLSTGQATSDQIRVVFALLYAANMYFQSYGAVAIVKVNAHWFHVRERGGFSGIFGTMISSGIFLAFTVNGWILDAAARGTSEVLAAKWVFYAPAALLFLFFLIESFILRDTPSKAGHEDFDTGDASSGEEHVDIPILQIMKRVVTNPIIFTVALIEFCTGVIRNGVMHWFPIYAKEIWVLPGSHYLRHASLENFWVMVALGFAVGIPIFLIASRWKSRNRGWLFVTGALIMLIPFMQGGWGGILFVAGVIGANVAGWVSDLFFQSRRAPVAGILYAMLAVASIGMFFTLGGTKNQVGWADPPREFAAGDIVSRVAGEPVYSWGEVDAALTRVVQSLELDDGRVEIPVTVSRGSESSTDTLTLQIAGGSPPAWGVLPKNGLRVADGGATPEILALEPGDRILGVAGTPEKLGTRLSERPISTWKGVSDAVSSVPAVGIGRAKWNPEKRMCTYDGTGIPPGETPSTGVLFARIERDGSSFDVVLRDPKPTMRAGDKRDLSAGPVLTLNPLWLGLTVFIMSVGVIGTHGLLSGTATMDFGGRKGAATAVGMIDGFVYLGTGFQSISLGYLTTRNWNLWPVFLFPFGVIGFLLLRRIWYAIPKGKKAAH